MGLCHGCPGRLTPGCPASPRPCPSAAAPPSHAGCPLTATGRILLAPSPFLPGNLPCLLFPISLNPESTSRVRWVARDMCKLSESSWPGGEGEAVKPLCPSRVSLFSAGASHSTEVQSNIPQRWRPMCIGTHLMQPRQYLHICDPLNSPESSLLPCCGWRPSTHSQSCLPSHSGTSVSHRRC